VRESEEGNAMKTNGSRNGFSMVEVLVASTILVVIVMMLAMLFQQTSLAWRTGVRRADGFLQIRSAIGAVQRDASAAIDERTLPKDLRSQFGQQSFNSSQLRFFTLSGGTGEMPDSPSKVFRALTYVTYGTDGTRVETKLQGDGSPGIQQRGNVLNVANRAGSKNRPQVGNLRFNAKAGSDPNGLPLYVTIEADVTTTGYGLDIGAGSAGPDKTWDTKDDIKTWLEN
jgi:prepilin-type N-terminal cleavage/methylation domain-containing protein